MRPKGTYDCMAKAVNLPPDPHLLESMRAVGYTAETAIADLIDNSVAAGASAVHVLASSTGDSRISIFDNGGGMSREVALDAMRLAARSPKEERTSSDLGRFGLGLKTASLSQCRRLTVASRRDGMTIILRWDLDHVAASGKWEVLELDATDGPSLFGWNLLAEASSGTLVCWDNLDLFSMTEGAAQADFDAAIVRVRSHCELVFHRFIGGAEARKISMTFNGKPLMELDPFLRTHKATHRRTETVKVADVQLNVQAFTLPYINKLSREQREKATVAGAFRDSQGFYIYRGGRLVIWGTWFRLNPKNELGKLARVQVDVPNALDHLWALDIKKSQATPPREMRDALRTLAGQMVGPSARVQRFRGRKPKSDDNLTRAWEVVVGRDNEFSYQVNRDHPVLKAVAEALAPEQLARLNDALALLEDTFPVEDAHNRMSDDKRLAQPSADVDALVAKAMGLRVLFDDQSDDEFLAMLQTTEPYGSTAGFELAFQKATVSKG